MGKMHDIDRKAEREELVHMERIARAIRLFLLFVIFWMIGSTYIFRKELAQLLLTLDRSVSSATAVPAQPLSTKLQETLQTIDAVSEEAERRRNLMQQIQIK